MNAQGVRAHSPKNSLPKSTANALSAARSCRKTTTTKTKTAGISPLHWRRRLDPNETRTRTDKKADMTFPIQPPQFNPNQAPPTAAPAYAPPVPPPAYAPPVPPPAYAPPVPPAYAPPAPPPVDVARMYAAADSAKPKYDRAYLCGSDDKHCPGDYVLRFEGITPIEVPAHGNPSAFAGQATILDFEVIESAHPSNPVGSKRSYFVKQDAYAFGQLRNWFFAACGLSEQANEKEIAAFLSTAPNALANALISAVNDRETHGGLKGRMLRATVAVKRSKPKPAAPEGFLFARASFRPYP